MTKTLPHERKYVLSPENVQVARDMVGALATRDQEKVDSALKPVEMLL